MPDTLPASAPKLSHSRLSRSRLTCSRLSRSLVAAAGAIGLLLAATLALWAHYGTAVFYETILAGLAACL
jgi:hypothetical protein